MNQKLSKYLDGLFSQYEDETAIRELKEELKVSLQERWNDLKGQGYDDETAYKMTIDSIGDISEAVRSVAGKTKEGTIFEKAGLDGTFFKNSVLRNVSFRNTKVKKAIFDGAAMDKITYAVLKGYGANLTGVTVF